MPLYEEKLISPLAIRFSQTRIRSTFRDGHTLEESFGQIHSESAPSSVSYNVLLKAPFPPIEVVRWRPRLRDAHGCALEDDSGEAMLGGECWFTLDNRRLYCLQKAATRALPHSAAAIVRVMYDIPTVRSISRKFKTTTAGNSVHITDHHDTSPILTWDWESQECVTSLRTHGGSLGSLAQVREDEEMRDHTFLHDAPPSPGLCVAFSPVVKESKKLDSTHHRDNTPASSPSGYEAGQALLATVRGNTKIETSTNDLHQLWQQQEILMQQQWQQQAFAQQVWAWQQQRQQYYEHQQYLHLQQHTVVQQQLDWQRAQFQQKHSYDEKQNPSSGSQGVEPDPKKTVFVI